MIAFKPIRSIHCLLLMLMVALAGCAGTELRQNVQPTARDLNNDRILVTVAAITPGATASLAASGRLNYQPPDTARLRAMQLETAKRIADEFNLLLEEEWPIPALDVHCFVFRMNGSTEDRETMIARLDAQPDIDSAQALQFFDGKTAASNAEENLQDDDPLAGWNTELLERLRALHAHATGTRSTIAVIDTGIDVAHEDLDGMRLRAVDLVDGRKQVPPEMHGTAIVGLMSARAGNGKGIRGYAPDAEVLLYRACWEANGHPSAVCNTFTLAKGMSLALEAGADIVNLSVSGPRDPLLERLGERMVERGQLLIAAGRDTQSFPASIPRSVLAARHALMPEASGPSMTLLPGNRYGMRNGTSIMAAKVSAAAALMQQLLPELTPEQLDAALSRDSVPPAADVAALLRVSSVVDQAMID